MKLKRRLMVIVPLILLLSVTIVIAYLHIEENKKLSDFNYLLNNGSSNISKVFMRDGMTLNSVSTTDKAKIRELVQLVNNRHYTKAADQEARAGFISFYNFYVGNTKYLTISGSGSNVNINGTYYNVDKPISTDELTKWFNSLPVAKWPKSAK